MLHRRYVYTPGLEDKHAVLHVLEGQQKRGDFASIVENIQADSDVLASVSLGPILLNRELFDLSSFRAVSIQRRNEARYHF